MTSKRVSAPADLMSEFDDDDAATQISRTTGAKPIQTALKQPTLTPTRTLETAHFNPHTELAQRETHQWVSGQSVLASKAISSAGTEPPY